MYHKVSEKYKIIKELGRGGYGTVYLAQHKQLGKFKAIKELTPKTKAEKKRIEREVCILQEAQHPYVIKIDEVIESDQATYICMEYAQGGSLEEKLHHHLPTNTSIEITLDILKGIQTLHARGIIHRDLKPGNILFDNTGKAKIGDFGIAKSNINISKLTKTGKTLGTIGYMAPEQLLGNKDEIDEQSDIYAVGIMLYEMLTDEHPLKGVNQIETVTRALSERYIVRLEEYKIDKKLRDICYKAISKNKSKRYTYASEMLEDLMTYHVTHEHKITQSIFYSKTLQQILVGLTTGLLLTGISSKILSSKDTLVDKWQQIHKEHEMLSTTVHTKEQELFKLRLKNVQRNIYNELQQESEFNITEDILKGKELYTLGMIYYKGKGVKSNYKLAYQYFEQASKYNIVDAYLNLGDMTLRGEGTEINQEKAIEYYEWVAKHNDPRGYHNLGETYIKNTLDNHKGIEYFKKSAAMNYAQSIERLVTIFRISDKKKELMYYIKKGTQLNNSFCLGLLGKYLLIEKYDLKQNEKEGLDYIKKAIFYGDIESIEFLLSYKKLSKNKQDKIFQDLFKFIENKKENITSVQLTLLAYMYCKGYGVEPNYIKAKELYESAVKLGNRTAMFNLGCMYTSENGFKKNYSKAKELYENAIELGSTNAMTNLGTMYEKGNGIPKNYTKAKELYENAIKLGDLKAMYNLGIMYYNGHGVQKNYLKAKQLYENAIKLGNANAMSSLGVMYYNGHGVQKNYSKAKQLYENAIELGNANAMANLGLMYYHGKGVQQNYPKAKELFEDAIKLGNVDSIENLGVMYYSGHGVEQNYLKAKQLFEKAIEFNNADAMANLGVMYYSGHGVEQNYLKAKELLEQAIELNNTSAMANLGVIYYSGHGIEQNYSKAKQLFEKAIELGQTNTVAHLGVMYHNGYGVQRNYLKAIKLYETAVKIGSPDAMYNLGTLYHHGHGVQKDYLKAIKLYEEAIKLNNAAAMANLGGMYYSGHGVKQNYLKAKELFENAVKLGNSNAMTNLGVMYYHGHEVKKNKQKAIKLFENAASLGNKNAVKYLKILK